MNSDDLRVSGFLYDFKIHLLYVSPMPKIKVLVTESFLNEKNSCMAIIAIDIVQFFRVKFSALFLMCVAQILSHFDLPIAHKCNILRIE